MNLYLDTSDNLKTVIGLNGRRFTRSYPSPRQQDVLGFLLKILARQNLDLSRLTSLQVNPGPGSFTGLRVGLSLANALSYTLNLPINGQPPGSIIYPVYGKPTSITPNPHSIRNPQCRK